MKKELIITLSAIALLGAGLGLVMYFNNKKNTGTGDKGEGDKGDEKKAEEEVEEIVDDTEYSDGNPIQGSELPLRLGSKGRRVAMLQAALNKTKGANLIIDGDFGQKTVDALKKQALIHCIGYMGCELSKDQWAKIVNEAVKDAGFKKYANGNTGMLSVYKKYSS